MPRIKVHHKDTGLLAKDFQIEEQNALIEAELEARQQKAFRRGNYLQGQRQHAVAHLAKSFEINFI